MSKIHDLSGGIFCHTQLNASTQVKLLRLSITNNVTKMTEDNVSQLGDYGAHSVNDNTLMGLVISLCSNSDHLISLIPPKLPQILDIFSVVAL